jgi:hypothetical protein
MIDSRKDCVFRYTHRGLIAMRKRGRPRIGEARLTAREIKARYINRLKAKGGKNYSVSLRDFDLVSRLEQHAQKMSLSSGQAISDIVERYVSSDDFINEMGNSDMQSVKSISAIGTRGEAKGKVFLAKKDALGRFVLNRKASSPGKGNTTNRAENKVYAEDLAEVASLLKTDDYLINLVSDDGKRALRELKKVTIT